ncbi:hypothetical protein LLT6_09965 [Lactococcus cremoris subsp. cremoris TIFN6]|uniref:Uncharacterized protein n=1 Tax=Lactococcus cremoris subsp. cremoris TIFN6 TaxID=1234876 RepID=T0SEH6_LACLC|nr:hypothetical protein LLT6_09965 [Lactococcus cremoris subsp. cremoris TIFN6]
MVIYRWKSATKNKNKKESTTGLLNTFIVLLFIVGLVLIFNKPIRNMMIATKSNHYQLQNVSKEKIEKIKRLM